MKFLYRKHIDAFKWNNCIEQAAHYLPYALFEYLDAIAEKSWAAVILGDYDAVFPVVYRRKFGLIPYIYQPVFCQQLGVFGKSHLPVDDFIAHIPGYFLRIHLQIHGSSGIPKRAHALPNYVKKAPHQWEKDLNKDAQKNIRKLQKLEVYYTQTRDLGIITKLYDGAWGKKAGLKWPKHYLAFELACSSLLSRDMIYACIAQQKNQILGAAIFLKGKNRLHYVCAAPTENGREIGIMHGIIYHVMEHFPNYDVDFEGSQIPSVASFYKKFNPQNEPYYRIERTLWL